MKACKFCGSQVDNAVQHCPTCGSNIFLHICENCGSQFDSGFCPNCGVKAGQKKKICPECGSAYFTNACPSCGYTPARKPAVQEIVHKHVYVEPEPKPQPTPTQARQIKKKGKGCGCGTIFIVLLLIALIFGNSTRNKTTKVTGYSSSTGSKTTAKATTTTKPKPTATPDPEIVSAQNMVDQFLASEGQDSSDSASSEKTEIGIDARVRQIQDQARRKTVTVHTASYLNGRGQVDTTGKEPDYIGVVGYAAVYDDEDLDKNAEFSKTPWTIPVYKKDKQFWEEAGTINHKTKVVVIGQELEKPTRSYSTSKWKGYLHVIRLDTGKDCYLKAVNFATSAYWEKGLTDAIEKGYCIAEFKQVSDYYPVTKGMEKTELEDGTMVLLQMKSLVYSTSPDKKNNPVAGIVFKDWKYGFGGVTVFFNEADLTLTY